MEWVGVVGGEERGEARERACTIAVEHYASKGRINTCAFTSVSAPDVHTL